ncbi:MAG TPA: hypothetical protein VG365_13355 [Solirubrobacteraceae bacterium]|jgi:hypothetical protein|nr:hypothetical protein [Solirubrobacteraceae bacterium]
MILLSAIVAGISAAVALIGVLVRQGFRDGDVRCDARVRARVLAAANPPVPAGWVEVTITNPSSATALVALALRPVRFARMSSVVQRRTGGRRVRLTLSDKVLGAVAPEQADRFWLWADADPRRLRLHVAVGTPGRLRLHRLPLPDAEPDGDRRGREQVDDPRAPSAT